MRKLFGMGLAVAVIFRQRLFTAEVDAEIAQMEHERHAAKMNAEVSGV